MFIFTIFKPVEPYNKASIRELFIEVFNWDIYQKMSGCFCFRTTIKHGTLAVLWWRFCSLRWMNCSRSLVSNLPPNGSYIENNDLSFKEKKIFSIDLNCLIDSVSCMVLSNLFHSLTQKGKKEQKSFIRSDGKRWHGTCVWYRCALWCKKT